MTISNKKTAKWAAFCILGVLFIALVIVLLRPTPREKYSSNFEKIQAGDMKQKVSDLMGQPDEIKDCYTFWYSQANEETKAKCSEQYWYRGGLEQWLIVFDKDGKVIARSHNISY